MDALLNKFDWPVFTILVTVRVWLRVLMKSFVEVMSDVLYLMSESLNSGKEIGAIHKILVLIRKSTAKLRCIFSYFLSNYKQPYWRVL
jgi:hypothetical protein